LEPDFHASFHPPRHHRFTGGPEDDFRLLEPDFSAHPITHRPTLARNPYTGDDDLRLLEPDFTSRAVPMRRAIWPWSKPSAADMAEEDAKLLRSSRR
jgi:hypothetical protein